MNRFIPAILLSFVFVVNANTLQTQTISLNQGWNAVYLMVEPQSDDLNTLLSDTKIDMIASYFAPLSSVEFIDEPNEQNWKSAQWHKWIAPGREDSFLTNLYRLNSGRGYLVHATDDFNWQITGEVKFLKPNWQANAFTLIGFEVDETLPLTFADFFESSAAHQDLVAYRLIDDKWTLITEPNQTIVEPNQAYWIYSQGNSEFYGSLQISGVSSDGMVFQPGNNRYEIVVKNIGRIPADFLFKSVLGTDNSTPVPVAIELDSVAESELVSDITNYTSPFLLQGDKTKVSFVLQKNQINGQSARKSLLQISGFGIKRLIPIRAQL
ncbi:hypothetical protein [Catenovulum sediminis]|uniref:DUF4832 domain-containing protein n=1 Tax=Catenovulum sediminis TaxID=1740262 RepID=A0ABV1RK01_9ALTE